MWEILEIIFDFILLFLLVFIVISVFLNKKRKNYNVLKDNDYVKNFIIRYNLDMKKTSYRKVLNSLTIINSFIIAFSTIVCLQIESMVWKILITFVVCMALIYSLYEILGRFFKSHEKKN